MNKKHRGILIGMALGDGHINVRRNRRWPNSWHNSINIIHSSKQKEYADHKAGLLHSIFGGNLPSVVAFKNNGYPGVRFGKSDKYFRFLRKKLYCGRKKVFRPHVLDWLTDQGVAIWWMDDGGLSMKKRGGKIHAREGFLNVHEDIDTCQTIIEWFKQKYDVDFKAVKNKGSYRLRINTGDLKMFLPHIEPYVIPSMKYKVDMQYPDTSARRTVNPAVR